MSRTIFMYSCGSQLSLSTKTHLHLCIPTALQLSQIILLLIQMSSHYFLQTSVSKSIHLFITFDESFISITNVRNALCQ